MKCKCGKKAVFYRSHEGTGYCKKCLCYQVEKTFKRTVKKNGLIKKGDKLAVAISGGKDSSVLLYLLRDIQKNIPFEMFAISIDEGIKGYRNKSLIFAKKLAKSLGIKHHIFSFKDNIKITLDEMPKNRKHCTYCGVFRRYLLNKKSLGLHAKKLALGHNMDDEAQSIIMNVMRDDLSRFNRLGAFPEHSKNSKFIPRIKPLRNISEKEITAYAIIKKISFYEEECPMSHDNFRRDVQSVLNDIENKHAGTKIKIVSFYDKVKTYTNIKKKGKMKYCQKCGEPSANDLCKTCELLKKVLK
jgi:uncharacterized protein (TIGR00269 family)